MCIRILLWFGKLMQWNCHAIGTTFQNSSRFHTGWVHFRSHVNMLLVIEPVLDIVEIWSPFCLVLSFLPSQQLCNLSCPQENQLAQWFLVKFNLLSFFISYCWECFMHIQRNISIVTVFKDKTNLYNMCKIKLHRTSKCLWPIYIIYWYVCCEMIFFQRFHKSLYINP